MILEKSEIESILKQFYKKDCVYLKNADIEYPVARGTFEIASSPHVWIDSGHLNLVDFFIGYNELAILMLYSSLEDLRDELSEVAYKSFIVAANNLKLKKPINAHHFEGKIEVVRHLGNIYRTEYDFENGNWTGQIDLALVL